MSAGVGHAKKLERGCFHVHANRDGHTECANCAKWLSPLPMWAMSEAKGKAPAPTKYLTRTSAHVDKKGRPHWVDGDWKPLNPSSFAEAEQLIREWNASADVGWLDVEYQLPLHCTMCYHTCTETFGPYGLCSKCRHKETTMKCSKCGVYTKMFYNSVGPGLCKECFTIKNQNTVAKGKAMGVAPVRKNGDFWGLSPFNSPVGSQQWGYQGSGKNPYVITHYHSKRDGSTTIDGWACSCPSFTQNTPRDHCKHIIKIMSHLGVMPATVDAKHKGTLKKMVGVNDAQLEAFKKWQVEQAEKSSKPTKDDIVLDDGIMSTGRKFR